MSWKKRNREDKVGISSLQILTKTSAKINREKNERTIIRNEKEITIHLAEFDGQKNVIKNFMPINLKTWIKWINF